VGARVGRAGTAVVACPVEVQGPEAVVSSLARPGRARCPSIRAGSPVRKCSFGRLQRPQVQLRTTPAPSTFVEERRTRPWFSWTVSPSSTLTIVAGSGTLGFRNVPFRADPAGALGHRVVRIRVVE
jgi:hypothetical protein